MSESIIIELAKSYLDDNGIGYVDSASLGRVNSNKREVIFPVPETLDPNIAIVEPPDVRVWVDSKSKNVILIEQM